jgi:hypothetical protein
MRLIQQRQVYALRLWLDDLVVRLRQENQRRSAGEQAQRHDAQYAPPQTAAPTGAVSRWQGTLIATYYTISRRALRHGVFTFIPRLGATPSAPYRSEKYNKQHGAAAGWGIHERSRCYTPN